MKLLVSITIFCLIVSVLILILTFGSPFGYNTEDIPEDALAPEPENEAKKVYHIVPTRVTWAEAIQKCHERNMKLVSILSKEENDNVIKSIKAANQGEVGFWTSGTKQNKEGEYVWEDGIRVTFTDWENGTPDQLLLSEECIEIKGYNILKWNDQVCYLRLYYICEEHI